MLNKEDWMDITTQKDKGIYLKDIAAELGMHPKTVSRALLRGGPPSGKCKGKLLRRRICLIEILFFRPLKMRISTRSQQTTLLSIVVDLHEKYV